MDFAGVKAFMKEVGWGSMGTTDGKAVGVRPMGGWAWFEGELWCATSVDTDKVRQLKAVPYAEYCFAAPDGRHVRLAGPCEVSTDQQVKRRLWDAVPVLAKYIPDPAAPQYVVLRLKPERVRYAGTEDLKYESVEVD